MKFLDLFAGIGGFRLGMEEAGHECVGYVEWDKYARKSYEAIHDTEGEWTAHDITAVTDEDIQSLRGRGIDIICGGFPCQAFSVAGKRGGFDDTRGTLFFEIARFAKQIKPRLLLLENVKGLLSHDQGNTFGTILHTLDELGYDTEWQVLNSKDFGVPQSRERVFIVGHLRGSSGREVFPITGTGRTSIQPHGSSQGGREWVFPTVYTKAHRGDATYISEAGIIQLNNPVHSNDRVYHEDGLSPKINTMQGGNRQPFVLVKHFIRKLTPKECWRLQGFPDWTFDKAAEVNSDSQLYKQAGNSVTKNVIFAIAQRLS